MSVTAPKGTTGGTGARLLDIAIDHVRQHGIERTTVVSVAREAGMTHANVYRYFASKEALVDAITGAWLSDLESTLTAILDAPDPADDKLERLISAYARRQRDRMETEPRLYAAFLDALEALRPIVRRHRTRLRGFVVRVVDEGMGTGLFTVKKRDRAVSLVIDLHYRFTDPIAVARDKELPRAQFDARLDTALQVCLRALKSGAL
jgi:AcrR family transcriptional regulator